LETNNRSVAKRKHKTGDLEARQAIAASEDNDKTADAATSYPTTDQLG